MTAGPPRFDPAVTPTVEGEGVVLGPWRDDDAPAVLEMARDAQSREWSASMRSIDDLATARLWMSERTGHIDRVDFAVRDPSTGALLGRTGLHRFSEQDKVAEIGYGVHPAHRRQGIARRAVSAISTYGFGIGLARISLIHAVGNIGSCRVATSAGYAFEGVERMAIDHGDGVRHDVHRHARLATDSDEPSTAVAIEPVEIAAGRLQLRPPGRGDADDVLAMLADPEVELWNSGPKPMDPTRAQDWVARHADWSRGDHVTLGVYDATTGRLLGNVSLYAIDRDAANAEMGYRVAPWARGQGVATDAVSAVTRWAMDALGLVRIELFHAVENIASCRVAEKAGYEYEGTLRRSYRYGDGGLHDEHLHAIVRPDDAP